MEYSVIAYYLFEPFENPEQEAKRHKNFLRTLDSKGRIYHSKEGVNAQLSIANKDVEAYLQWLEGQEKYCVADIKIHYWHEHPFAKLTVKPRRELVALDREIDMAKKGSYLTPKEWREKLEQREKDVILIDVRNDYESSVGHFEGAICPPLKTFREFPAYAKSLAKEYEPQKTKVMMYCTGGIRCEIYSALLKEEGFETVYQLQGGVIRYGLEEGKKHWKGKLFVFDDRLVVPISDEKAESITTCKFCGTSMDTYYNCANMDCNDLFVSCPACIQHQKGCCSAQCLETGRVREFVYEEHPKPFRKLPHSVKQEI